MKLKNRMMMFCYRRPNFRDHCGCLKKSFREIIKILNCS